MGTMGMRKLLVVVCVLLGSSSIGIGLFNPAPAGEVCSAGKPTC